MSGIVEKLEKFAGSLSRWTNWVAGAGLVVMLALTVADVVGIKFFKWPVPGAIEMIGFLGVVVAAFAIAYTQLMRGHIQVEFVVMRLPSRARYGISAFASLLGLALFVLLSWRSFDFARVLQVTGEVSMTQRMPFYPFVYAIAVACIPVALVLLVEFLRSLAKAVRT